MSSSRGGPPGPECEVPAPTQEPAPANTLSDSTHHSSYHRRREAALRCEPRNGRRDPETDNTRFHRPATGLTAAGYRDGFAHGAADALRQVWLECPDVRPTIERIAAGYQQVVA